MLLFWMSLFFGKTAVAEVVYRHQTLHPLDFQAQQNQVALPDIAQVESDGEKLYLRSVKHPEIVVISPGGNLIQIIGGRGGHPREFGDIGVLAMSVRGNDLWAIDSELQRVRHFHQGIYQTSFPLDSYQLFFAHPTSNLFAFNREFVVVPAHPRTGHLARVTGWDGKFARNAGSLLAVDPDLRDRIRGINDTFWLFEQEKWYAVHKFFPLISEFDLSFNLKRQVQMESGILNQAAERIWAFVPTPQMQAPPPLITDVKIFRDHLYFMTQGHLHRLPLTSLTLDAVFTFKGEGADFAHVKSPSVMLFFFAFLNNGDLVLAHPAMPWNHDLWWVPGFSGGS